MSKISTSLQFFINLAKAKTVVSRRFDNKLSFIGIGFSEFMILYHISQAPEQKMRRIDLAEKIGLTASGVTRILLPMEKIGLVKKEANEQDARVSFIVIAEGGKRLLLEATENAELLAQDILPETEAKNMQRLSEKLTEMGKITIY